jgi:hypothetical protein
MIRSSITAVAQDFVFGDRLRNQDMSGDVVNTVAIYPHHGVASSHRITSRPKMDVPPNSTFVSNNWRWMYHQTMRS